MSLILLFPALARAKTGKKWFFNCCAHVPQRIPTKFTLFVAMPKPVYHVKFQPDRPTGGRAVGRGVGQPGLIGQKRQKSSVFFFLLHFEPLFTDPNINLQMSIWYQKNSTPLAVQHVEGFHHTSTLVKDNGGVKCDTNRESPCIKRPDKIKNNL